MFGATNAAAKVGSEADEYVTVTLTAARSETLMGLQGRFAVSDASGNLVLTAVTVVPRLGGMVVGDLSGGAFVLSGSGTEISGTILTATYLVKAGTAAGSYELPITIEAAMVDGVPIEDEMVVATVEVSAKQAAPVEQTAPTNESAIKTETNEAATTVANTNSETDVADDSDEKTDEAATNQDETKKTSVPAAKTQTTKTPSAETVLAATAEDTVAPSFNPTGIVVASVMALVTVAIISGFMIWKKKTIKNGLGDQT